MEPRKPPTDPTPAPATALQALARLLAKRGLRPGLLPAAERHALLALVWAGLPAAGPQREAEVNALLQAQLAGPAACLDIDHVELRRWLVDAGLLQRDGYGRAYARTAAQELPAEARPWAAALQGLDAAAWAQDLQAQQQAAREARRAAWQAAQPQDVAAGAR